MVRAWVLVALVACDAGDRTHVDASTDPIDASAIGEPQAAPSIPGAQPRAETNPASLEAAPTSERTGACRAPSLTLRGTLDARDDEAAARCERAALGPARLAKPCGRVEGPEIDLDRLDATILVDSNVEAHVRRIAAQGRELGRRRHVFGLVGDSMTVSGAFLRPLADPERTRLGPEVKARLGGVIARYRGAHAQRVRGLWRDAFRAPRAAKVGARASWALAGGAHSPLARMVEDLSPAIAFVLYGGNDAAYRVAPVAEIERTFRADLEAIVAALEARGVVPVLHTLARHGDAPGVDDCGAGGPSDWRIAVYTNALSRVAAQVACARHLPLIDLRWALDAADLHGMSADGVHPSTHRDGGGALDTDTLRCGYNVRNYVTLRMLARLDPLLP